MRVIVYGTLMNGYGNNRLLETAKFVDTIIVQGYKLYYSGFPVATLSAEDSIHAEVWEINDDGTLDRLDRLEAEGTMYDRVTIFEDTYMYVGCIPFWDFETMEECPKVDGIYKWGS